MNLTIGIASYRNPDKLAATIASIVQQSTTNWNMLIVHNPSEGDQATRDVIQRAVDSDQRIKVIWNDRNEGYCGAVNRLLDETSIDHEAIAEPDREYVAYCDNDVEIRTRGWDEKLIEVLENNAECGWVFPGPGHYGFYNGRYNECLWNAGYCWMLRRSVADDIGVFDTDLGHHEEVDYMIRMRLAGFTVGCRPDVQVVHHETATRGDEAVHKPGGRIHDGVVRWMNKWNGYFCGDVLKYSMTAYDPRALRYTDWPPCALYLERLTLANFPRWNQQVEEVAVPGAGVMDAVKVLKPRGPYRGRAI